VTSAVTQLQPVSPSSQDVGALPLASWAVSAALAAALLLDLELWCDAQPVTARTSASSVDGRDDEERDARRGPGR
jgi:hypothetical protein